MNAKDFLKRIRSGHLSVDEIGRGMHKCYKNACELIEDADLLIKNLPARSISLAILALEEIAKIILLANAAAIVAKAQVSWKDIEDKLNLRLHKYKQEIFSAYGSAILDKLASTNEQFSKTKEKLPGGIVPLLDYFKQLGFYVDVADGQFISPADFGTNNREWADCLMSLVKERLIRFEPLHGTEESSLELARKSAEFSDVFTKITTKDEFNQKVRELLKSFQL